MCVRVWLCVWGWGALLFQVRVTFAPLGASELFAVAVTKKSEHKENRVLASNTVSIDHSKTCDKLPTKDQVGTLGPDREVTVYR